MSQRFFLLTVLLLLVVSGVAFAENTAWHELEYTPAPVDNPLKGLVPYAHFTDGDLFPHSMEFEYFPVSTVVVGPDTYDWTQLEMFLDKLQNKGMQAVFRFYLEYPGKPSGVPKHLLDNGLKCTQYQRDGKNIITPDYTNPALREMMVSFILSLGRKYDGDPRIGYITAGLLGHWGEWHSSPRNELFANKSVQEEIMSAYEAAFKKTPILLRYPAGLNDPVYIANANRRFGYHDDSFAWATLPVKDWYFLSKLNRAGAMAREKWKTQPIGGEIRPEAWGIVFDKKPKRREIQDFNKCVKATHVTWLMDSGLFKSGSSTEERRNRAMEQVRGMGYEYYLSKVALRIMSSQKLEVVVHLENLGVAPFYQDWPLEYGLLDAKGNLIKTYHTQDQLKGLLPDETRVWRNELELTGISIGDYQVLLHAPNPMNGGRPLKFANSDQDADLQGWVTLGKISIGINE